MGHDETLTPMVVFTVTSWALKMTAFETGVTKDLHGSYLIITRAGVTVLDHNANRMTASVLKQDPNTQKVKMNVIYKDKTKCWILSSTGHENNLAQSKADKCPSSTSHFSPFNCCLSVVL